MTTMFQCCCFCYSACRELCFIHQTIEGETAGAATKRIQVSAPKVDVEGKNGYRENKVLRIINNLYAAY